MHEPFGVSWLLLIALTLPSVLFAEVPATQEPTNLPATRPKLSRKGVELDPKYLAFVSNLPPAEQAWERVLQHELGGIYLINHMRDRVAGVSTAWDYVPDDPALPRVLLIGDSVSRAYTLTVREMLKGEANVHRAPANCGPVGRGLESLDVWLGDGDWDVIYFNFGIHNRSTPVGEYARQLEEFIQRLKKTNATLVWATTTPIPDVAGQSNQSIVRLNAAAAELTKKHGILVDDLYATILPQIKTLQRPNDVHFTPEGNTFLGERVAEYLLQLPEIGAGNASKHLFILSGQSNMAALNPELSFTPVVQKRFGAENVVVVKDAHGGQSIRRWYKGSRSPSGDQPKVVGDLYDRLMVKVNEQVSTQHFDTVTFVWMQGESDTHAPGDVYADSLSGLVKQVSADLDRDDINVVVGRISDFDMTNEKKKYWTEVRDAQVEFAKSDPRAAWVDTDDLNDRRKGPGEPVVNDVHYTKRGYKELGARFAKCAIDLIQQNSGTP